MLPRNHLSAASDADSTEDFPPIPESPPASNRDRLHCAGLSHAGRVRHHNEDHFLVARLAKSMKILQTNLPNRGPTRFSDEDGYLLVVADGMGGANAGERASALAVASIEEFTLNTLKWFVHLGGRGESALLDELRHSIEAADRSIFDEAGGDRQLSGMGTTLTMGYCVGPDLYVVHAGDSRAYLGRDGQVEQITCDHTLVQLLVDNGLLTPEGAKTHARRNVVTNVVGGPQPGVHSEIHKVRLLHGDAILFCSDGLTEVVPDSVIAATLAGTGTPEDQASHLLHLALKAGAPDNVTVLVARYHGVDPDPTPSPAAAS